MENSSAMIIVGHGGRTFRVSTAWPGDGNFWQRFASNNWEPGNLTVLQNHLKPGSEFVDIGAFIGPISLVAASLGAIVSAYEPDPAAFARLVVNANANPSLRDQIKLYNAGIWTFDGQHIIAPGPFGYGDSMSTFDEAEAKDSHQIVNVVDGARLRADFVKIDIEGGEFVLVPYLAKSLLKGRPSLLLSTHCRERYSNLFGKFLSRLRQAVKMASIFWALRGYQQQFKVSNNSPTGLTPLNIWERIHSLVGLNEREFFFTRQ